MRAEAGISIIIAIVGGVALSLIDSGWLVNEWASNPTRMGAYTILSLALGASVNSVLRSAIDSGRKRAEEREQRQEKIREQEERRAAAERMQAAQARREAELADRVESLNEEQVALLATAYSYGVVERDYDTRDAVILKGMAKLGLVKEDGVGVLAGTWKLTPDCRRVMDEMGKGERGDAHG